MLLASEPRAAILHVNEPNFSGQILAAQGSKVQDFLTVKKKSQSPADMV